MSLSNDCLRAIRAGHRGIHVVVDPASVAIGKPLPANLDAVFEAESVTDSGFVQLRYLNRDYGPTLHADALRALVRTYEPLEADDD